MRSKVVLLSAAAALSTPVSLVYGQPNPETIIQYFSTSWREVTARVPELAAAGYTAIWLPPPTKGAEGTADVGFSVFDRFDLGDRDQRGTIPTRYGTRDDAVKLVQEAHRFGIKVYFDTVMNHNANPAKIENAGVSLQPVRIDEFPGTTPLDYHVLPARPAPQHGTDAWEVRNAGIFGGGTYIMRPDTGANERIVAVVEMPMGVTIPGFTHLARAPWIDFSRAGINEEQHLSLLGLIDFAIEQVIAGGQPAASDGTNLIAEVRLPRYVRLPERPETYPNNMPVPEDIREYMMRWIRWFGDTTDCDGLRLDAIKHVPTTFFASDFGNDPVDFNGAFQSNLDQRRGWSDGDDDDGVQDALLFGESFTGDLGSLQSYRNTGMYLLDFPLLFKLAHDNGVFAKWGDGDIGQLSYPQGGMAGAFNEFGGLGRTAGVSFVQSHDTNAPGAQPNSAYAYTLTRVGHSVVFYDGNNYTPDTFVRPGRLDAVGELGSSVITDLIDARRRFARGGMFNRFVDGDTYVYERLVPTSDGSGGATLLVAITDNTQTEARFGEFDSRPLLVTEFPPGTVLREVTGNGSLPQVTVLDPAMIPQGARDRATREYERSSDFPLPNRYGVVYLQIPQGPDHGYVAYAPRTPPMSVALGDGSALLAPREIITAPERATPAGAPIAAAVIRPGVLTIPKKLSIRVGSDETAEGAYFRIGAGEAVPGLTPETGTPDGLYDGFLTLPRAGGGSTFEISDLDLSALPAAVHVLTLRVRAAGTPSFYSEARVLFLIERAEERPDGGVEPLADGGMVSPDAAVVVPDGGVVDPDRDPDRDGVPNDSDVCPGVADPSQSDFDGDGVGDACDRCPETEAGAPVDATGCRAIDRGTRDALDAIVRAIVTESVDPNLDQNGDGKVDSIDFVLRAKAGGIP